MTKGVKPNGFYVYALTNPTTENFVVGEYSFIGTPFYLGKGKDDRAFDHMREAKRNPVKCNHHKVNTILRLAEQNIEPLIHVIQDGLTDAEALELEGKLGDLIGYRYENTGPLTNLIKTGTKNPIMTGDSNPFYGKIHSLETKQKISIASKEWHKNLSDSERDIINKKRSNANKGCVVSKELAEYRLECKFGKDFRIKIQLRELEKLKQASERKAKAKKRRDIISARSEAYRYLKDNKLLHVGETNPMYGKGHLLQGAKNGRATKIVIRIGQYVFHVEGALKRFCCAFKAHFKCSDPVRSEGFKLRYGVTITVVDDFIDDPSAIYFIDETSFSSIKETYEKCKSR